MTKDEFFEDLAKYTRETGTQWFRNYYGATDKIRCDDGFNCPISFVATRKTGIKYISCEVWDASEEIGLAHEEAASIVNAADARGEYSHWLRDRLLKATQLELR